MGKKTENKVGEEWRNWNPCIAGGIVKWYNCFGKQCDGSSELDIEFLYDPAIILQDTYPEELKAGTQRDHCILLFMAALCTITKRWKQPMNN